MITTREINVNLGKGRKLGRITTKDIDASIKVEQPKDKAIKTPIISTHNMADVADIAEKRRRDEIMASIKTNNKKLDMKEKMAKVRAAKGKKE